MSESQSWEGERLWRDKLDDIRNLVRQELVTRQLRDHLPDFENDDRATLAISVGPPPTHKVWAAESGFLFPVLSDFWPHGAVSQAYGVFNDDVGISNRGTFVVDRSGMIRFAEMKQAGEIRDQRLWTDALAELKV